MATGVRPTRLQEEDDDEQERKNRREKQASTDKVKAKEMALNPDRGLV